MPTTLNAITVAGETLVELIRDTIGTAMAAGTGGFTVSDGSDSISVLNKTVVWPTGSEPSLAGVPDGTLWVEYTP